MEQMGDDSCGKQPRLHNPLLHQPGELTDCQDYGFGTFSSFGSAEPVIFSLVASLLNCDLKKAFLTYPLTLPFTRQRHCWACARLQGVTYTRAQTEKCCLELMQRCCIKTASLRSRMQSPASLCSTCTRPPPKQARETHTSTHIGQLYGTYYSLEPSSR